MRTSRPAGTLRHKRTGRRYPLYRGLAGGRKMLILTRRRGGVRREIVAIQPELETFPHGGSEKRQAEAFARSPSRTRSSAVHHTTTRDGKGVRLRLSHVTLHAILSRLHPEQLRMLVGGDLPADPARAVVRGVARIARRARPVRRWRSRGSDQSLEVFVAPGYGLLVRRTGPREGEIVMLTPLRASRGSSIARSAG